MKKTTFICLALTSIFACNEATKSTSAAKDTTQSSTNNTQPNVSGAELAAKDAAEITEVIHSFYKWYTVFLDDATRNAHFIDSKGTAAILDLPKLSSVHGEMVKSGFVSNAFVANDLAYLKKCEAEWKKNNENGSDGPLTGLDFERVFCGQDWDIKAYTTGSVKAEGLGTDKAKATVESSKIELVKENGKWLISKIACE